MWWVAGSTAAWVAMTNVRPVLRRALDPTPQATAHGIPRMGARDPGSTATMCTSYTLTGAGTRLSTLSLRLPGHCESAFGSEVTIWDGGGALALPSLSGLSSAFGLYSAGVPLTHIVPHVGTHLLTCGGPCTHVAMSTC